jgi:hypothetical protein
VHVERQHRHDVLGRMVANLGHLHTHGAGVSGDWGCGGGWAAAAGCGGLSLWQLRLRTAGSDQ